MNNSLILPPLNVQSKKNNLELKLFSQPLINFNEDNLQFPKARFEILSRFYDKKKLINPVDIFENSLNEENLTNLDLIIFEETYKKLNHYIKTGWEYGNNFVVGINVSDISVKNYKYYLGEIEKISKNYELVPKKNVFLEINEKSKLGLPEFVISAYKRGFGISIDDLGTESFTILRLRKQIIPYIDDKSRLKVKIDLSFVKDLLNKSNLYSESDKLFVKSIISHKIPFPKLKVVAEGIEDLKTAKYLKGLGVDLGQGFYFSKPFEFTKDYIQPKFNYK